jgi:hypothetical protein
MATADAKLLPPPPFPSAQDSDQNLDSVGPIAVLGAMVDQRTRASRPPAPAKDIEPPLGHDLLDDDGDADDTQPRKVPHYSDAFLKVR